MKHLKLGLALSSESDDPSEFICKLETALSYSNEAVEVSLTTLQRVKNLDNPKIVSLIKKFKYRSVHMPVRIETEYFSYPSAHRQLNAALPEIDKLIVAIDAGTVLFHPNQIEDFQWPKKKYGSLLAFENMDSRTRNGNSKMGHSLEEMVKIFEHCPSANWVFDINHLFTNDHSMATADKFYSTLKNRLCHYHVSSFGGFHDSFCRIKEDIILSGIKDLNHPLIHEGHALENGVLKEEIAYVNNKLLLK